MTSKMNTEFKPYKSYLLLFLSIIGLLCFAFFIYIQIEKLYKLSLQEQVKAITQTAVLNYDTEILDQIQGAESVGTQVYEDVVLSLQKLKLQNPSLRFVDIYRKTDQPHLFEYVADSNSLHPDIPIDDNGDGIIDEMDEQIWPGDIYDGSVAPSFVENAFVKPDVSDELETSQWGSTLDASSPIFDDNGKSNYALNVSVDVTEFTRKISLAFVPFSIFVFIIILDLVLLTLSLVKVWKSRVEFFAELDRQKDELLSIVSHQLATPISSMKWYLEMMLDGDIGKLTKEQTEHVESLQYSAANLSDLTSMILDVSRIQLGCMKVDRTDLDTKKFFTEVAKSINAKAKERGVILETNIPDALPVAMLDMRLMRMTLENLLSNAVKYTPKGGKVFLNVKAKGGDLYYEVKDTGCGIPKSDHDKIFGKLFRASNVQKVDGNGFGLYVAKGAVEAQGGEISFESEENKGTKFIVKLPIITKSTLHN